VLESRTTTGHYPRTKTRTRTTCSARPVGKI
ncbi:uncharacterized protein METZ01_LOCUS120786, partial [marine metagenome]